MKQARWVLGFCGFSLFATAGCGADQAPKSPRSLREEATRPRHNFSGAWIYTIGEVDSLGQADCDKAADLIDGEVKCNGQACRFARNLSRDYLASCRKVHKPERVSRIQELVVTFETRGSEPSVACTEKAAQWVAHGCGTDGACESAVQRWATHCGPVVRSPLTVHILERVIENSLREPRRVKLDVHGCDDFAKQLREAERCVMLRDCENGLPMVEQYMLRCAEGERHIVPLRVAFSMVRVQLGAQQELKPIALANQKALLETLPGLLVLSDNSGLVYKVCGEPVAELNAYLDRRQKCEKGEVALLRAVPRAGGPELGIVNVAHESDAVYSASFPNLFVNGEAAERERRALEQFNQLLTAEPDSNLSAWLSRLNQAYASLPNSLRRSEQIRQVFAQHDAQLVAPLRELTESKLRLLRRHASDLELVSFVRRAAKLPFSDVTNDGAVEWGATCDLSELALGDEVKAANAAIAEKLATLKQKANNPRFRGTEVFSELLTAANRQAKTCTNSKRKNLEILTAFDICTGGEKSCGEDELKTLWGQMASARTQWRSARAREIVLRVSAGSDDRSSAACSSL